MSNDTDRDARALARSLGADAVAELVRAVWHATPGGDRRDLSDFEAVARQLAEPAAVTPQWPTRVWVAFYPSTGDVSGITAIPQGGSDTYRIRLPARLVPLDGSAVVLTREEAVAAKDLLAMVAGSSAALAYQGLRHGLAEADDAAHYA